MKHVNCENYITPNQNFNSQIKVEFNDSFYTVDDLRYEFNTPACDKFIHAYDRNNHSFDFTPLLEDLPAKWHQFKSSRYRTPDNCGIPMEWELLWDDIDVSTIQIPNNLSTSLNQAFESPEWSQLKFVKRKGNKDTIKSYTLLISSLLHSASTKHLAKSGLEPFSTTIASLCNDSTFHSIMGYTIRGDYFETIDKYFVKANLLKLKKIYGLNKVFYKNLLELLQTPYSINGNTYQILYVQDRRHENSEVANWYYLLDPFFMNAKHCDYTPNRQSILNGVKQEVMKRVNQMSEFSLLKNEYSNWLQLGRPLKPILKDHIDSYIGKVLKGKIVVTEDIMPREKHSSNDFIYTEDIIDSANKYCYEDVFATAYFGSDHFRHYTPYSMSSCIVREMYTYKGKSLKQCDVSSMYPVILLQEYMNKYCKYNFEKIRIKKIIEAENPRKVIFELCKLAGIDIDEDQLKRENLKYYNERNARVQKMALHEFYTTYLPGFAEWLAQLKVKSATKGYAGYKVVSRFLEHKESIIMDRVLAKCHENNIFALGVHDAVDCEEGSERKVQRWIKESMKQEGYICNVTID